MYELLRTVSDKRKCPQFNPFDRPDGKAVGAFASAYLSLASVVCSYAEVLKGTRSSAMIPSRYALLSKVYVQVSWESNRAEWAVMGQERPNTLTPLTSDMVETPAERFNACIASIG